MEQEFRSSQVIDDQTWLVRRRGKIEEVEEWDGRIKYRVIVHDVGRGPFVNQLFGSLESARHFYNKLRKETEVRG